jgi:nitrite reductase/ring-hydroxylating ferredoxin subunit
MPREASDPRDEPELKMAGWIRICGTDDCPVGEGREFVVGQRIVAVFRTEP